MSVSVRGLAVVWRRLFQRPVSKAKPRSLWQRIDRNRVVVGLVVGGQWPAVEGLFDRGIDAVTSAFVAGVGEGGQREMGGGPVADEFSGDIEHGTIGDHVESSLVK
jgi:hypothetical protein